MERVVTYNAENCFICQEIMGAFKNDLTVVTGYSEKTIFQLIEEFTSISINEEIAQEAGICQNCFIKFNEYDEHQTLANQIQQGILSLFESSNDCLQDVKQELEISEGSTNVYETYQESPIDDIFVTNDENPNIYWTEEKDPPEIAMKFKPPPPQTLTMDNMTDDNLSETKHKDLLKTFQCELCFRKFKEKSKLKSHRLIHTTERNVICPTCGKAFKTQACLRSHKRVHNPVFLFCDLCGKSYTQKPEMAKHIKFVHLHIREFFCQMCGSGFGSKGHLSTHLLTHSDQSAKTVKCEVCGAAFFTRAKLERHMKTHTKERNYECGICNKKFLYSYNVTAHIRHVHYGEKRKESEKFCSFCSKKFQKLWALQEHMAKEHQVIESIVEEEIYEADFV